MDSSSIIQLKSAIMKEKDPKIRAEMAYNVIMNQEIEKDEGKIVYKAPVPWFFQKAAVEKMLEQNKNE